MKFKRQISIFLVLVMVFSSMVMGGLVHNVEASSQVTDECASVENNPNIAEYLHIAPQNMSWAPINGDPTVFKRGSGANVEGAYFTVIAPEGNITNFTVDTYRQSNFANEFSFFTSDDNVNFTEVTAAKTSISGDSTWTEGARFSITSGIGKKYLKVVYPDCSQDGGYQWDCVVTRFSFDFGTGTGMPSPSPIQSSAFDVTISDIDQQTVKGWGCFPAWNRADWNSNFMDKEGAQQALLNDLGITMFRIMYTPYCGDANGNIVEAKMQEVYDLVNLCHTKGLDEYIVSVWSMPIGMKTIATVNGWTGSQHVKLRTEKEEAYCDFLVNATQWLVNKGCAAPKAISFQNEPLSQIISEWCYWGGDNGAQYQRVAKKLRAKLDSAGLTQVQIIAPEGASYRQNETLLGEGFAALNNDLELKEAIGGFASHSYVWQGVKTPEMFQQYKEACDNFPEKDRWQTEYCPLITDISDIDMAINTAQRLASDMAFIGNNYWFWWLGWNHQREPSEVGEVLLGGDGHTVEKTKAFYVLSKIFNNVSVGSKVRRVNAEPASGMTTSDEIWMDSVAFVDGDKTVALLTNPTNEAISVNVKGLTGVTAEVYTTASNQPSEEDMVLAAKKNILAGTASEIKLPARSVSVIITSEYDTAAPSIVFTRGDSSSTKDAGYAVRNTEFVLQGFLDEPGSLTVNGEAVTVQADLSFSTTLNLQVGDNSISCIAVDSAGNVGSPTNLFIRVDPAYVGITLDQQSLKFVNLPVYTVSGKVNTNSTVKIIHNVGETTNEVTCQAVAMTDSVYSIFNTELTLGEGDNTITVSAADISDNEAIPVTIHVIYDISPPVIEIPLEGTTLTTSYVLKGSVNEASEIKVNGVKINLADDNTFATVIPVLKGLNNITVDAKDIAGNTSQVVVSVTCNPTEDGALAKGITGAHRVEGEIVVDGSLEEPTWKINNRVEKIISGQSDNNVTFGTQWDEDYLYIGVKVLDASLISDSELAYKDDSVEIYIDGDNSKSGSYGGDDHQITLGWHDTGLSVGSNIIGIQQAQLDIDGGYTVEFAIPWIGIGIETPSTYSVIGFDVGCNDDDGNNSGERDGQLMWHGGDNNWTDTSAFGSLYLIDEKNSAAAIKPEDTVTIDGIIDEASWNLSSNVKKAISGASDNGVRFGTLCDTEYLYVGIEVLDAKLINDSDQNYRDDSVEIYIDPDNSKDGIYDSNDHQIILGWHDEQITAGRAGTEEIQFAQTDIDGGYTVEVAIPWSWLNITPSRYMTVGFDIGNNDDDGNNGGERDSQLMWNGNEDNWTSTSRFGNLLLHNLDYPLKQDTGSEPENLVEFIDECANTSLIYDMSAHISTANWEPHKFAGDADRLCHTNDKPQVPEYVIYSSTGDIYSFDILTGLYSGTPAFKIFGAPEGGDFAEINVNASAIGGESNFLVYSVKANKLKSGIRYLKIEFPGSDNWKEQLCKVTFKYIGQPVVVVPKEQFVDNCDDLSKLYAKSGNINLASWDAEKFGGDTGRIGASKDNAQNPEYVIYNSPSGDICSVDIQTGLFMGTQKFKIYGSAEGEVFNEITTESNVEGGSSGYTLYSQKASNLDAGIRFIKIQFPGDEGWKEHICNVAFEYEVLADSSITPQMVQFDKNTTNQEDIPITVTLNGNALSSIKNGDYTLIEGSDYSAVGNVYTISKNYLNTLEVGIAQITFSFSAGTPLVLQVIILESADENEFTVGSVRFTNALGEEISAIPASGLIKAEVSFSNTTTTAKQATLIVALYDEGGDIHNLSYITKDVSANGSEYFTAGFSIPEQHTGYTIKVMVWDNFINQNALSDVVSLN